MAKLTNSGVEVWKSIDQIEPFLLSKFGKHSFEEEIKIELYCDTFLDIDIIDLPGIPEVVTHDEMKHIEKYLIQVDLLVGVLDDQTDNESVKQLTRKIDPHGLKTCVVYTKLNKRVDSLDYLNNYFHKRVENSITDNIFWVSLYSTPERSFFIEQKKFTTGLLQLEKMEDDFFDLYLVHNRFLQKCGLSKFKTYFYNRVLRIYKEQSLPVVLKSVSHKIFQIGKKFDKRSKFDWRKRIDVQIYHHLHHQSSRSSHIDIGSKCHSIWNNFKRRKRRTI